jgi:hypothetical protein
MLTLKYLHIHMLYLCFTPDSPLWIDVTAVILLHLHIFIDTPALLVLYSYFSWCVCVCPCRLTGLIECVEESEGLRRDGPWEHGVLQQRAAGEAPLHEPPHVCLLLFSLLCRHVLVCRSVSVFVELPTGVVWIRRSMCLYRRWDAGFLVVRCQLCH